jgi:sensor domain CHASE-containing protein
MPIRQPRYSKEEAARRGDEIYDRNVRAQVEPQLNGEIVAIDLDTGAWEVDPDQDAAADRLEARLPDAQIWVVRVGSRYITRFGAGLSKNVA